MSVQTFLNIRLSTGSTFYSSSLTPATNGTVTNLRIRRTSFDSALDSIQFPNPMFISHLNLRHVSSRGFSVRSEVEVPFPRSNSCFPCLDPWFGSFEPNQVITDLWSSYFLNLN